MAGPGKHLYRAVSIKIIVCKPSYFREAAKDRLFLVARPLRGGGGVSAWTLKKTAFFEALKKVLRTNSNLEHVVHAQGKIGLFGGKIQFVAALD